MAVWSRICSRLCARDISLARPRCSCFAMVLRLATSDRRSRSHVEGDRSLDGLQAHASGAEAIDFCKTQIIRESSSFDVSTYGAELAGLLARGWCHRISYYFKIATEINDFACIFTAAQKAAFIESEEFSRSALAEGHIVRVLRRLAQIRDTFPS